MRDDISECEPGELPKLDDYNRLVRRGNREIVGQDFYEDETGIVIMGGDETATTAPRHFELKDGHDPGTTTTAYYQEWNSVTEVWETTADSDHEFDVTDPLSEYRGRGKDTFSSPHDTGSEGVAEKNSESGEWEIVRMQPHALWLVGELYADFATSAATFEVHPNPEICFPIGSIITDTDPAANITVHNIHDWDYDTGNGSPSGVKVSVRWNEAQTRWEAPELDCSP